MTKHTSAIVYSIANLILDLAIVTWVVLVNLSFLESHTLKNVLILLSPSIVTIGVGYFIRLALFRKQRFNEIVAAITYAPLLVSFTVTPIIVCGKDAFEWSFFVEVITTVAATFIGYLIADFCDYNNNQYLFPPI